MLVVALFFSPPQKFKAFGRILLSFFLPGPLPQHKIRKRGKLFLCLLKRRVNGLSTHPYNAITIAMIAPTGTVVLQ